MAHYKFRIPKQYYEETAIPKPILPSQQHLTLIAGGEHVGFKKITTKMG